MKIWLVMVTKIKLTQWVIGNCNICYLFMHLNGLPDLTEIQNQDFLGDDDVSFKYCHANKIIANKIMAKCDIMNVTNQNQTLVKMSQVIILLAWWYKTLKNWIMHL